MTCEFACFIGVSEIDTIAPERTKSVGCFSRFVSGRPASRARTPVPASEADQTPDTVVSNAASAPSTHSTQNVPITVIESTANDENHDDHAARTFSLLSNPSSVKPRIPTTARDVSPRRLGLLAHRQRSICGRRRRLMAVRTATKMTELDSGSGGIWLGPESSCALDTAYVVHE